MLVVCACYLLVNSYNLDLRDWSMDINLGGKKTNEMVFVGKFLKEVSYLEKTKKIHEYLWENSRKIKLEMAQIMCVWIDLCSILSFPRNRICSDMQYILFLGPTDAPAGTNILNLA